VYALAFASAVSALVVASAAAVLIASLLALLAFVVASVAAVLIASLFALLALVVASLAAVLIASVLAVLMSPLTVFLITVLPASVMLSRPTLALVLATSSVYFLA
jgi:hypothetical protein